MTNSQGVFSVSFCIVAVFERTVTDTRVKSCDVNMRESVQQNVITKPLQLHLDSIP